MLKYFKYLFWIMLVVVPCTVTVLIYNDKITQNSPVYYKQGVKFYNEGDYANAYYNFGKIKFISPLYPMALYKQAKSAQKTGDYKSAVLKYNMFLKKMPESVLDKAARLNLAKSYYYLKQYDNAKIEFEKLVQKINNWGCEEVFFLGLVEKNYNKEKAAYYFRKYLQTALNDEAVNKYYIIASAAELSKLGINLSFDDIKLIGKAYFKERRYDEALNYFSKLPVNQCWDYLVLSNYQSGNKEIAKKLIEKEITTYSFRSEENNLHKIYDIYASNLTGNKIKNYLQTEKFVSDNKLNGNDYVLFKLAQISPDDKAIIYYRQIYRNYPKSKYAPEALWNIIWYSYKKHEYNNAENLAFEHLKMYKNVKSTPKVMFWLGKIYLKQNKISDFRSILNKLISKYPDNYYGLRSVAALGQNNDFWSVSAKNKLPRNSENIDFPLSTSDLDLKDLKLINTIFDLGDYEIWLDVNFSNPAAESWFEFKNGKKSRSIVLARDEINKMEIKAPIMSAIYKLAYPVYMSEEINISGEKLTLDPFLIISIIREESHFNAKAKSATGAIGLMQLMPQTAGFIANKLNEYDFVNIEDEKTNLYLGCIYLKYLKERFNNDLFVVAAYNGGEGSVQRWIKNFNTNDFDEFIENIPYEETRNYIKKVFRTYKMYKKIYNYT